MSDPWGGTPSAESISWDSTPIRHSEVDLEQLPVLTAGEENNEYPQNVQPSESDHIHDHESDLTGDSQEPEQATSYASEDADTRDERSKLIVKQEVTTNYGVMAGTFRQIIRRIIDSHELSSQYVEDCRRTYAPPPDISEALQILKSRRVVVLLGPQGVGRHSSAIWLLGQAESSNRIHEVRREPTENFEINALSEEELGIGWILDLRSEEDHVAPTFGRALLSSSQILSKRESFLIVLARPELWSEAGIGAGEIGITLKPAKPEEVVRLRLSEDLAMPDEEIASWLAEPGIAAGLKGLIPSEAVKWAAAIKAEEVAYKSTQALSSDLEPKSDTEILAQKAKNVVSARSSWRDHLLLWHKEHIDSRKRNFLLAAALLEAARTETIFTAAEELALEFDEPAPHAPGLTGPGILELVDDSGATLQPDGETITFRRSGYADAILEYFWIDRMHLRESFITWMCRTSLHIEEDLADDVLNRIGQYVLRWSAKQEKIDALERLLIAWSKEPKLAPAAVELLTVAGLDLSLGRTTRERMLIWARSDNADNASIQSVAAKACGGPLGQMYPKMMLLRLSYLATTSDPAVRQAVKDSVQAMWAIPSARPRICTDLANWLASDNKTLRAAGRATFIALAELVRAQEIPLLLEDYQLEQARLDGATRTVVIRGWRSILDEPATSDEAQPAFNRWMDSALADSRIQELVTSLLLHAAYTQEDEVWNARRHVTLARLLFTWSPPDASRGVRLRDGLIAASSHRDPFQQAGSFSYTSTRFDAEQTA